MAAGSDKRKATMNNWKPPRLRDMRLSQDAFLEAQSICEYEAGGFLIGFNKTPRTRRKYFKKCKYLAVKAILFEYNYN